MKLWNKQNTKLHPLVESFTIGEDRELDLMIAKYDVIASLAHGEMLFNQNLISDEDWLQIRSSLDLLLNEIASGQFIIENEFEDVHSKIEHELIMSCGDAGKKIHTGRSRNDQVLTAIKMLYRDYCDLLNNKTHELAYLAKQLKNKFSKYEMPGYTHMQVAMPSSFELWFGAFEESLLEDAQIFLDMKKHINRSPLGSGAGYGVPFNIDRKFTANKLEFEGLNENVVYAQMTRGKCDKQMLFALSQLSATLNKWASDIVLYMGQDFSFFSFPSQFTTGSSIMPHKKNPDVFELIRAETNRIIAAQNEVNLLCANLPSGYHRDMQLLKNIVFPCLTKTEEILDLFILCIREIQIRKDILQHDKYKFITSVIEIEKLVKKGMSFRDAYKTVGEKLELVNSVPQNANP